MPATDHIAIIIDDPRRPRDRRPDAATVLKTIAARMVVICVILATPSLARAVGG